MKVEWGMMYAGQQRCEQDNGGGAGAVQFYSQRSNNETADCPRAAAAFKTSGNKNCGLFNQTPLARCPPACRPPSTSHLMAAPALMPGTPPPHLPPAQRSPSLLPPWPLPQPPLPPPPPPSPLPYLSAVAVHNLLVKAGPSPLSPFPCALPHLLAPQSCCRPPPRPLFTLCPRPLAYLALTSLPESRSGTSPPDQD